MAKPDGGSSVKRGVAGTLLAWLFFAMDGVIGFILPQRNGEPTGRTAGMPDTGDEAAANRRTAPGRKLATGTAVIGAIGGFTWMIVLSLLLPNHPVTNNVALWGGVVTGIGIWAALLLRARHTGKFDL
jgi:hypothetical protein